MLLTGTTGQSIPMFDSDGGRRGRSQPHSDMDSPVKDANGQNSYLYGPTEELTINVNKQFTSVKIPRKLMELWSEMDEEGAELARIRVYDGGRVFLSIKRRDGSDKDDIYELDTIKPSSTAPKLWVVADQALSAPADLQMSNPDKYPPQRNTAHLLGHINKLQSMRPVDVRRPPQEVRTKPKKPLTIGNLRRIRMLTGAATHAGFTNMIQPKGRDGFEKRARMPQNELLDILFKLFENQPRWTFKDLRNRSQQPDVYLRDVLSFIARRSGDQWELMPEFCTPSAEARAKIQSKLCEEIAHMMPEINDEDEDDMEQIL